LNERAEAPKSVQILIVMRSVVLVNT
jgi:hypothetical protein